jgi:D-alanyl-D-alanine carboxypeptidase/D-alanyl-D-alanine-endopeptidase (penicillin-binding protein 4)
LLDLQSGRVLVEQNGDQPFLPASVAKLVTAYAAIEILGPDFRFSTLLYRRGSDVYLKGGGDPVLTSKDLQGLALHCAMRARRPKSFVSSMMIA